MSQQTERIYEFGPFRLDSVRRTLLREGEPVSLTSKVFDTLLVLVEHRAEVLSKEQLIRALWPDVWVEENNLTQHISMLRKALGERAGEHRYVVTVPGRGYSFVAAVREVSQHEATGISLSEEGQGEFEKQAMERPPVTAATVAAAPAPLSFTAPPRRTQRLAATIALIILAVATLSAYRLWAERRSRTQGGDARPRSIAVLPFQAIGTGADGELLGAGMADAVITRLSHLRQIAVRPTSAITGYAGREQDTMAAGRALGVDAVLEGTVQSAGERVRVTVQLIQMSDGSPVWAQSFDERYTDIFVLQDSVSEQVARALLPELSGEEQRRVRRHETESVEAYQAYLRGRHFWNKRNEEGLRKSIEYFQQAIDLDAAYAQAHAGLADAYNVLAGYHYGELAPEEYFRRAKAAATRALEINESVAEAHASLALINTYYERDADMAEREYRRAIELNPSYATAHHWYSDFLAMRGRPEEALREAQEASELDPLSPIIATTLGERLYFARRYREAVAQLRKTLEVERDFIPALYLLGMAYEQTGDTRAAVAVLERARALSGGKLNNVLSALGHAYATSGRRGEARQVLGLLMEGEHRMPYDVALLFASLGEKQEALRWLRKAQEKDKVGIETIHLLRSDPRLDALRSDAEFQSSVAGL
ncbi:MAG TPA: winged helix-turn-helix domain-containing protein [Pyrinomonadaceae bacterium]|jgi:DNA-binding winged helix-turn-helix (wHTH) protein/TolB-like protein